MNILAIETCCLYLSLAINAGGKITYKELDQAYKQAEQLFPLLQKMLEESYLTAQYLNKIIVTHGPGSFTGTRIGLAAAKGLKASNPEVGFIGATTLQTIAYGFFLENSPNEEFYVALDVKRNQLALQLFDCNAFPKTNIKPCTYEEASNITQGKLVIGNGTKYLTAKERHNYNLPHAKFLAQIAASPDFFDNLTLNPTAFYIREPDLGN